MENNLVSIEPFANTSQHVTKVLGVANAIAYYFSRGGGPIIALGLAVTGLFLPDVLAAFGKVSLQVGTHVFAAIDDKTLQSAVDTADARLSEFSEQFAKVTKYFQLWTGSPSAQERANAKVSLRDYYSFFIIDKLPALKGAFIHAQYGGFMVAQFAAASAQYLTVLKMYYSYAEELDLPAVSPVSGGVQDLLLQKWRMDLANIVDTGVASYRLGLQNIISGTANVPRSWDDYNKFRNSVTITGMDVLASLQYSDPYLYKRACNLRNKNRKLVTFLDASADTSRALKYRGSIQFVDNAYNPLDGVSLLQKLEMSSAKQARDPVFGPYKDIDGLIGVQSTALAADGSGSIFQRPYSGWLPKPSSTHTRLLIFDRLCYWISGRHRYRWTNSVAQPAIAEMSFYLNFNDQRFFDFSATGVLPNQVREFSSSLPEDSNQKPQWGDVEKYHQHRLVNMFVDVTPADEVHNYVFSWRHVTALQDMLPETSHIGAAGDAIATEQFHAIRAESSIRAQKLGIIAGPGFTGGDLVELRAQQSLRFYLKQTSDKWFAGRYEVRLWYVRPASPLVIEVNAIPQENFPSSRIRMSIAESGDVANINALKFRDVISLLMPGHLLITANMSEVELQLLNASTSGFIVIDRIELIFLSVASSPEGDTSEMI